MNNYSSIYINDEFKYWCKNLNPEYFSVLTRKTLFYFDNKIVKPWLNDYIVSSILDMEKLKGH